MALLSRPLLFTLSLLVSFISVFVYVAGKFISIIIYPRQYYRHAQCSLRAGGCLQGGQEGMSSEQRNESQIEKERRICRVQSHLPGGGVRGEQWNE